jgi:hypothetical protein
MRADYATSDLISKVNSDWINAVLVNREFDRTDAGDDGAVGDLTLQPGSGKQIVAPWPKPAPPSAKSNGIEEPVITVEPVAWPRPRSVARRVTERLALAVAALAVAWMGVRMAPEPRDAMDTASVRATIASPEFAVPINTAGLRPGWLLPEILYGPAMASSPISVPRPGR